MADLSDNRVHMDTLDDRRGLPVEAALMGTAMAIATVLVPQGQGNVDYLNDAMILGFAGFLLFLVSKGSLISSGRMSTWGPRPMRGVFKVTYLLGYVLMLIGGAGMAFITA